MFERKIAPAFCTFVEYRKTALGISTPSWTKIEQLALLVEADTFLDSIHAAKATATQLM